MFRRELDVLSYFAESGAPVRSVVTHSHWVVASQDCDLDQTAGDSNGPTVEIRMVQEGTAPDGGIRSRRFGLTRQVSTDASSPRLHVAASLLTLEDVVRTRTNLDHVRARMFKTWLGLRYDRPAVAPLLVEAVRAISVLVAEQAGAEIRAELHDVLLDFRSGSGGDGPTPVVDVFLLVADSADAEAVQAWFAACAFDGLDAAVVVPGRIRAVTRAQLTLEVLENTYSADLSKLTYGWKGLSGPPRR